MKRFALTIVIIGTLQTIALAQKKTSYGDDVGTIDGIIQAYYNVVTVKKGEKISYQRDSLLHIPNAMVGIVRKTKIGESKLQMITLKQYHKNSDASLEKDGFYESEISRQVENFGAIYQVWSTYQTKYEANGPVISRGINSIQLYFDGTRFWIISWAFDSESKEQPIPRKYLK
jgi:hypothetical protein